jgi:hypothetical protein
MTAVNYVHFWLALVMAASSLTLAISRGQFFCALFFQIILWFALASDYAIPACLRCQKFCA